MRRTTCILLALLLLMAPSCRNARKGRQPKAENIETTTGPVEVRYAQGFSLMAEASK